MRNIDFDLVVLGMDKTIQHLSDDYWVNSNIEYNPFSNGVEDCDSIINIQLRIRYMSYK